MKLLKHLNLHFGYEASNMDEFVEDFKEDFEGDDEYAVNSLLSFLSSLNEKMESYKLDDLVSKITDENRHEEIN